MALIEDKAVLLNFLKHDWFQKADGRVSVHLYVKSVEDCHVAFEEEKTTVSFSTSDVNFLKIHGTQFQAELEDTKRIKFSYSISTREKIIPDQSSFKVQNSFVELHLMKAAPNKRWPSLEILKSSTNRNKTSIQSPSVNVEKNVRPDSSCSSTNEDHNSNKLVFNDKNNVPTSAVRRFPENMQLLGGKSTPVFKKLAEQETKPEKETGSSSDQQSTGAVDTESQKNVNKTASFKTEALGLTGLENYANNCYMNVVIQVLANIPEIRDYFIGEHFLNSLSTNNPMSSGGRVAKAFYEVINALWSDNRSVVRPQVLKNIMGKRCSLFMGFQQCDAQEFFATLLDNLHEDLKLVPRCDKTNESGSNKEEETTSCNDKPDVAWDCHLKRNNSMMVKLFHGQMVSKLTCQSCHKKSVTYEPCAQVSLPIPMYKRKLRIMVFFKETARRPVMTVLQVSSAHAQLWHVLNMLEKRINIPAHCLRAIQVSRGSLMHVFDEDSPVSSINSSKILVACEVRDEKEADLIALPFLQHKAQSVRLNNCGHCKKSQHDLETKLKRCTRCMHISYCCRECQTKHWPMHQKECRKGYKESVGLPFIVSIRKPKTNYETLASAVAHYASVSVAFNRVNEKDSDSSESDQEDRNRVPKDATNTLQKPGENSRRIASSSDFEHEDRNRLPRTLDESCNTSAKVGDDDCRASSESDNVERNRTVKVEGASNVGLKTTEAFVIKAFYKADQEPVLITADDFKLDLVSSATYLSVEWQSNCVREKEMKELQAEVNVISDPIVDVINNGDDDEKCTIEDCLSMFMEPDRISESDGWKCPKCKTVQSAKKEMALTFPPPIMLVHFKRFTYASYGQKITKPIYYPLSGLDLSNYLAHETRECLSVPPVYDLTGVICHRGSMGIGHYTCMVQTLGHLGQTDIGWRYFDDDQVSKLSEDNVISSAAYVLVYRMRGIASLLKLESPFLALHAAGSDVKQDKAAALAKSFNRQLSAESTLKDKSKCTGNIESVASSPKLPMKRSNSTEPLLYRKSSGLQTGDNIEIEAQKRIYSESRLRDYETPGKTQTNKEASLDVKTDRADSYRSVFDYDDDNFEGGETIFASTGGVAHMNSDFNRIALDNETAIAEEPLFDENDMLKEHQPRDKEITSMETEFCGAGPQVVQSRGEPHFNAPSFSQEGLVEIDLNSESNEFDLTHEDINLNFDVGSRGKLDEDELWKIYLNDITENELD